MDYRIDHKLNRAKMAKLCGISEYMLARLEEPYSMFCPRDKILLKIFENLEITKDELMEVMTHDEKLKNINFTWIWEKRNEDRLLKYYHQMNGKGREIALEQIRTLAEQKKY